MKPLPEGQQKIFWIGLTNYDIDFITMAIKRAKEEILASMQTDPNISPEELFKETREITNYLDQLPKTIQFWMKRHS